MSIDPIALSKTGSIEKSTYGSTPSLAAGSGSPLGLGGSAISAASKADTSKAPGVSSSAFIVDQSLATLLDNGSKGLSGTSLATYNSQALLTQNTGSLISNLGAGGDAFTSEVVGSSSSWNLYRTMQSAATNAAMSTDASEGPVQTALAPTKASAREGTATSGSSALFADVLQTSQTVYGTGSTIKATTSVPETKSTTTASATTPATSEAPTGSAALFADVLQTSQTVYGTGSTVKETTSAPEAKSTTTASTTTPATSEAPTGSAAVFADILKTSQTINGSGSRAG